MLEYLHVKNLALIREAEIEFKDGLNILSGETGAGKSILLGSVSLALGGRADKDMIRHGEEFAYVELIFRVDHDEVREKLKAIDVYPEDDRVILSRRITENRSVSKLNGETVTASLVKQAAELLIDIHGQHDHQSLLHEENHGPVVDSFGRDMIETSLSEYGMVYREYREKKEEIRKLGGDDEDERQRKIDFLSFEIEEIENAKLRVGEEDELTTVHKRLANGKDISDGLSLISGILSEDISEPLERAVRTILPLVRFDENLKGLSEALSDLEALASDAQKEADAFLSETEHDEEALYETEKRLDEINSLKRKYGNSEEQILKSLESFMHERDALLTFNENREQLLSELSALQKKLVAAAQKLREDRRKAAAVFDARMTEALRELNFLDVQFVTEICESNRYSKTGADEIRFLISTNPGEALKPLSRVASGGELSRIMLAIRTLIADRDSVETLIFDEIDTGISGKTGAAVSEKMHEISNGRQVICISHLPQIVAMADHHFLLEKKAVDRATVVRVEELSEDSSDRELARLLGAGEVTDTVLANAREMKKQMRERIKR